MLLKTIKNIPGRVVRAFAYSWGGFKSALIREESFRLEAMGLAILLAALLPAPWPVWKKLALTAAYLLIPLAELFNSALEDLCDLVSPDDNLYVKSAKDKGSAAVLLAIIIASLTLAILLWL
ncbi:MAG: diacylglycerol kinase [Candidatus Adiutrix sp.]|jgi:diacylglycerol kinase (ATP)|nr:diacylglycerol kinase [Candidatus Adiutrix sp.]